MTSEAGFSNLPPEILWRVNDFAIHNGDENNFNQVDTRCSDVNLDKMKSFVRSILTSADRSTSLSRYICTLINEPTGTVSDCHAFFEKIVLKANALGIKQLKKVMTPEQVNELGGKAEDLALEKIWPKICEEIDAIQSHDSYPTTAPEIRDFLKNNAPLLQRIIMLDLSYLELKILPAEIKYFSSLTSLTFAHNELTELPPEIGGLVSMLHLDLSSNKISSLPDEIEKLTLLLTITLERNEIKVLNPKIGKLQSLLVLHLMENKLESLPAEIGQLVSLVTIDLSDNQLKKFPDEFWDLANLNNIQVLNNHLTTLSAKIGQLRNLENLNLSKNRLVNLPFTIGQLSNLRKLLVDSNLLKSLPPSITSMAALEELNVSNNLIRKLPLDTLQTGQLANLNTLKLKNNQLKILPSQLGELLALRELNLSDNNIDSLPSALGRLTNLVSLNVSNNHLKSLPPEILNLGRLWFLEASNNQLEELFPVLLQEGHLANLYELILSHNKLTELPGIEHLKGLRILELDYNQFQMFPFVIDCRLTEISVSNNHITAIPVYIRHRSLVKFDVGNNPIQHYPPFLASMGTFLAPLSFFYGLCSANTMEEINNLLSYIPDGIKERVDLWVEKRLRTRKGDYAIHWVSLYKKAILTALYFDKYPENLQNSVDYWVYARSGFPETDDREWGKHHAHDDMDIYADAVFAAILAHSKFEGILFINDYGKEDMDWGKLHELDEVRLVSHELIHLALLGFACLTTETNVLYELRDSLVAFKNQSTPQNALLEGIKLCLFGDGRRIPSNPKLNEIYRAIYFLSGRPQTDDWQWGEHNAFKDLNILLQACELVQNNIVKI